MSVARTVSRHTGLRAAHNVTVLPSGTVVLFGSQPGEQPGFHVYGSRGEWRKLKQLPRLCEHEQCSMVPETMDNQEFLVVSCRWCEVIRLLNLETGESNTAFHNRWCQPMNMCKGGEGQIFLGCSDKNEQERSYSYLQLSTLEPRFQLVNVVTTTSQPIAAMCYSPTHNLIIAHHGWLLRAVCVARGTVVWENPVWVSPCVFVPALDAILGPYLCSPSLLVLSASDGDEMQFLTPDDVTDVRDLCLHGNSLVVLHGDRDVTVSFCSLLGCEESDRNQNTIEESDPDRCRIEELDQNRNIIEESEPDRCRIEASALVAGTLETQPEA